MKLIISDLDGTLLNNEGDVNQHTIDVIRELVEKTDVKFAIATGRGYDSAIKIKRKIGLDIYMICNNGANIYDEKEVLIEKNFIPKELCQKIIKIFTENKIDYKAFKGLDFYLPEYGDVVEEDIQKEYNMIVVKDIEKDIKELEKILVINETKEVLENARKLVEENFSEYLEIVISSPVCLDLNVKNCSKKLGVERIIKELKISPEDIMAFGDSENDYKMLKFIGKPIAMKDSYMSKHLKNSTFLTNDENGLADYIEKMILKK